MGIKVNKAEIEEYLRLALDRKLSCRWAENTVT